MPIGYYHESMILTRARLLIAVSAAALTAYACFPDIPGLLRPGTGGTGGANGVGGACALGEQVDCYTGLAGTEGIGTCRGGRRACDDPEQACLGEVLPEVEDCVTQQDEDCNARPCEGQLIYLRSFGTPSAENATDIAAGPDGTFFVAGSFESTLDLGTGELVSQGKTDAFVFALEADGSTRWATSFGAAGYDDVGVGGPAASLVGGPSLAVGPDGAVFVAVSADVGSVAGQDGTSRDLVMLKLSAERGDVIWARRFGGADQQIPAGLVISDDILHVSGTFNGTMTVDIANKSLTLTSEQSTNDIFLLKLDAATGEPQRLVGFGGAASDRVRGIAGTPEGDVWLGGKFSGEIDFGGTVQLTGTAENNPMFVALISGETYEGIFGAAYRNTDPSETGSLRALATGPLGEPAFAGDYQDDLLLGGVILQSLAQSADAFVGRLASDNTLRWARSYGDDSSYQTHWGVAVDARGQVVVAGNMSGTVDFGIAELVGFEPTVNASADAHVLKLTRDGVPAWLFTLRGPSFQTAMAVAIGSDGSVGVAGIYNGDIDDPATPHAGGGGADNNGDPPDDMFVLRLSP